MGVRNRSAGCCYPALSRVELVGALLDPRISRAPGQRAAFHGVTETKVTGVRRALGTTWTITGPAFSTGWCCTALHRVSSLFPSLNIDIRLASLGYHAVEGRQSRASLFPFHAFFLTRLFHMQRARGCRGGEAADAADTAEEKRVKLMHKHLRQHLEARKVCT